MAEREKPGLLEVVRQWAGLVGVVALFVALVMRNLTMGPPAARIAALGVGAAAIVASIVLNWRTIWGKIKARATKAGLASLSAAVLFLAILAGINYVGYRHPARADLTKQKVYTLSPQTQKVLKSLKKPVQVTAYYDTQGRGRASYQAARDLLDQYTRASRRINLQVVDLYSERFDVQAARSKGINQFPCVVVESESNREIINEWEVNEEKMTSAIMKVTGGEPRKVYFLTGHGEGDPDSYDREAGMNSFKQALLEENYEVATLNLLETKTVPTDCTALIIAGPRVDLGDQEAQALKEYFDAGGRVLLIIAPPPAPTLEKVLLAELDIKVRDDLVAEPAMNIAGSLLDPVVVKYPSHAITTPLQNMISAFPVARSLVVGKPENRAPGEQVTELVKTSDSSWGETNRFNLEYTEGKDTKGPLVLAAAAGMEVNGTTPADKKEETPQKSKRLVVVTSAYAASNAYFALYGNKNFFPNAVDWLAEAEDLIAIRPRSREAPPLMLATSQAKTLRLVSLWLVPGLLLVLGLSIWWKRR